ncbi:ferredoxin-NADP reductase [Microbacterium sp. Root61]|uniref:NAD(P)/FAD-dependent oxidoreductase n=1 Tax=Microbacterium sp. Root61 TaxID=1736570 RepID=UPI0006FC8813|nr:NAD(P)/FAD-dependent oxidoreductase [Microbacterium sp. Root61]KRA24909.1 ferredoxin-NADP reductase [Microbacterium sp. Root61]
MPTADLLIIGAGPAGLFATYYAGMRGLSVVLVDSLTHLGGQVSALYPEKFVYDVAGFPAVHGRDLIAGLVEQASSADPHIILGEECSTVEDQVDGSIRVTTTAGTQIECGAVLITGGIGRFTPRPLPAVDVYRGAGIHRLVGPAVEYTEHDVVIVGGGDSAVDWANMLAETARSVTLIHRRAGFTAHESSVARLRESAARVVLESEISEVLGDETVRHIVIRNAKTGDVETVPASVVIPALGHIASLGPLSGWGLSIRGRQIDVATNMSTGRSKVFAAGDITDYPGKVRLMAVGFGEAATAVNNIAVILRPGEEVFPGHSSELSRPEPARIGA